jgi:hypothetical protein
MENSGIQIEVVRRNEIGKPYSIKVDALTEATASEFSWWVLSLVHPELDRSEHIEAYIKWGEIAEISLNKRARRRIINKLYNNNYIDIDLDKNEKIKKKVINNIMEILN